MRDIFTFREKSKMIDKSKTSFWWCLIKDDVDDYMRMNKKSKARKKRNAERKQKKKAEQVKESETKEKKGWKERERMKTSWHTFVNVDLNQHILFLEAGQNFVT